MLFWVIYFAVKPGQAHSPKDFIYASPDFFKSGHIDRFVHDCYKQKNK